ncbi:MAG: ATP-binding cassette domain-containing protein [Methanomicrobiaceae archaeon]|nr:ATP-binding cassette domain-containing protein [Methanomicrobiaceae archaeon]MDD5420426.1 ATP-binding cassette domain-containing protein [Methanomicrobiaceae archaeon]
MSCNGEIICLENIYTAYEGAAYPVIRGISLAIRQGEYAIVGGPNGAGKTTLLESINGMLTITHGNAYVCGMDVRRHGHEIRRKVGYVVQSFYFDPLTPFTAEEVITMGRYGLMGLLKRPGEADYRAAEAAIRLLGLEDIAHKPIGTLSGGQQQKVLIAQNIAKEPELMLLDEPFSNLDLCTREFVSGVLRELSRKGIAVVMVCHAFDGLPDERIRILVMRDGSLCLDETCDPDLVEAKVRRASVVQ